MADGKMSQDDIDAMLAALSGDAPIVIPAGTPAPPTVPSEADIARMAKDAVGAPALGDKQVVNQQEIDAVMADVDTEMLRGSTPPPMVAQDITGDGAIDQADLDEADQIRMRLGRCHAGRRRQIFQRQRAAVVGQGSQQLAADFDALDAARAGVFHPAILPCELNIDKSIRFR